MYDLSSNKETIQPWLEFFLNAVYRQASLAIELVADDNFEKLLSPIQQSVWVYLQRVNEAAPLTLANELQIPRSTVSQALNKLLQLQKIERIGMGRATRYRVIDGD